MASWTFSTANNGVLMTEAEGATFAFPKNTATIRTSGDTVFVEPISGGTPYFKDDFTSLTHAGADAEAKAAVVRTFLFA